MYLRVSKSPNDFYALTNYVYVNPFDLPNSGTEIVSSSSDSNYLLLNDVYLFTVKSDNAIERGFISLSKNQRIWIQVALNDQVTIKYGLPFSSTKSLSSMNLTQKAYLTLLIIQIDFERALRAEEHVAPFDSVKIVESIKNQFDLQVFTLGQIFNIEMSGHRLKLRIHELKRNPIVEEGEGENAINWGILQKSMTETKVFKVAESRIQLIGTSESKYNPNVILRPNFNFEEMGIGGLDEEFSSIFRLVFQSRLLDQDSAKKMNIKHTKGLLLYGPPGTGKTLMARQIAKILNAHDPKIVNGPEILSKYVGESEKNIRALFADAEDEFRTKGDDSRLHIVIFDEIDALCRQRGTRSDSTGVGDQIVNQILTKMDGVEQINNILIIGMTNRLDLIDEALLRPGRFSVQIEIGLPTENGRLQIFKIHTSALREHGIMETDVSLPELASLAKNFTGAEIEGLVQTAQSYAISRHTNMKNVQEIKDINKLKVTREDFIRALSVVKPAYGPSLTDSVDYQKYKLIHYSDMVQKVLADGMLIIDDVKKSDNSPLGSILIHGSAGSGKTALAVTLARMSEIPLAKMISINSIADMSDAQAIDYICSTFKNAYKSNQSIIIIDNIEDIIQFDPIGPRCNVKMLHIFKYYIKTPPPKEGHKLVTITTTSEKDILFELLRNSRYCFETELHTPNVTSLESVELIIRDTEFLSVDDQRQMMTWIKNRLELGYRLDIGIKYLLNILNKSARNGENALKTFTEKLESYLIL